MKILFRSCCSDGAKYINASGHGIPELLAAILEFFPLDTYVFNPVTLMDMVNADKKKDMKVNTVWKLQDFSDIQILRGIKVGESAVSKIDISTRSEALNFVF